MTEYYLRFVRAVPLMGKKVDGLVGPFPEVLDVQRHYRELWDAQHDLTRDARVGKQVVDNKGRLVFVIS